jgi:Domain of unknown function (DUF4082)
MPEQLWADTLDPPHNPDSTETVFTLGTLFHLDNPGLLTHVRFHLASDQANVGDIAIWDTDESLLATVDTAGATVGWNTIALEEPLDLVAGGPYVVGLLTGPHFAQEAFYDWPVATANMHTPSTGGGAYNQGAELSYPFNTFQESCYFVDVVVDFTGGSDPGVHEISGSGTLAIDNPQWLTVELDDIPEWVPRGTDTPQTLYHVGVVALGDALRGWMPAQRLTREFGLVFCGGDFDLLGYALPSGITATVTEHAT